MNDQLYRQIDGVPMGSPLGPTLADILMTAFEDEIVRPLLSSNVIKFYSRYVDDTLVLIEIRGSFWTTVFREKGKQILKQFIRKPFSMTTGKRILKHFITKSFSVKIEYEFKYLLIKTNSTLHSGNTENTIICLI